jgi:hypothetical protein
MSFDHHSSIESVSGGSTFSSKTGPRRTPEICSAQALLGHVTAQTHYIEPVPPMYVTEYEANYTWPPQEAYENMPQSGRFEHSLEKHSSVLSIKDKKRRKGRLTYYIDIYFLKTQKKNILYNLTMLL